MSVLVEWLGAGGVPVHAGIAASRATVCETCPRNRKARWWEGAKTGVADVIRAHLQSKNDAELTVPNEAELGMCDVCGCVLALKVHTPMEHILSQTPLPEFPEHCWIKTP